MSYTLNYTVQRVLEKLNLDPVNSINDTEDALLISREAESTYFDLLARGDWPEVIDLIEVSSVSDLTLPTAASLADSVMYIKSVRYDCTEQGATKKNIKRITWLPPEEFLDRSYQLNSDNDNVFESDYKGTPILVWTNKMPDFYTSFDNKTLIFDSYDSQTEDTIQGHKVNCKGKVAPVWLQEDDFVIPLDQPTYPLFLSALTSACSLALLGTQNMEEARREQRAISRLRREAHRTEMETFPKFKFGRNGNGFS